MPLTKEETETIISFTATDREHAHVFSDDQFWQRKLEKAGAVITKTFSSGGKEYQLDARQISLRKLQGKREMTEQQRQNIRERFSKAKNPRKTEDV